MSLLYLPNFSTNINARNWPISLEVNRGGSGWFSSLAIYGVNNEDHVELFFMQAKGDRCNDGYAQWETNSTDHFGSAHAWTSATPFRLLNPFDDTNWRQAFFASQFTADNLQKQRESLFEATGKRPHRGWYPYYDISNCAICCAGKLLIKQSFIGNIFQEKDFQVVGVLLDMDEIKTLKDSSLKMDQCFADTLFNQSIPDEEAVDLPENSKFFSIDNWMKFGLNSTFGAPIKRPLSVKSLIQVICNQRTNVQKLISNYEMDIILLSYFLQPAVTASALVTTNNCGSDRS